MTKHNAKATKAIVARSPAAEQDALKSVVINGRIYTPHIGEMLNDAFLAAERAVAQAVDESLFVRIEERFADDVAAKLIPLHRHLSGDPEVKEALMEQWTGGGR